MSKQKVPDFILKRLRTNIKSANIPVPKKDLDGMIERGFIQYAVAFEELMQNIDRGSIPDYLTGWGALQTSRPQSWMEQKYLIEGTSTHQKFPSIYEIAQKVKNQKVSPVELTELALARIAERNPSLNAFQYVCTDLAREAALKAKLEIRSGGYRGMLHGIPVAIKDLLAMRGTPTTAGSKIFADRITDYDSAAVEKLKAAGAIIVGKTRLSEFAYSPGSNNAHYGPTHNPHSLQADSGGSSSGSGAAVADGLVFAALGTDTGGSIRIPAAQCGIVGLKPTYGRVSLFGADTLSWSLDHLGPMTRTVRDAAFMLQVLAGYDPRDPRTRDLPLFGLEQIDDGCRSIVIGMLRDDGTGNQLADQESLLAWNSGLELLSQAGAEIVEIDVPDFNSLRILNSSIISMEAATYHETTLSERFDDLGEFFRQRVLAAYAFGPTSYIQANQARSVLRKRVGKIFKSIDLISTPTMPTEAPALGTPASTTLTGPFNILGWPTISVPVGYTKQNLPLGLQLAGKPWDEATVLRVARVFDR
jgi:Asp-tRNA(Asn)/Glu-tRNA(Gln) amidotransferase A subunit family amidase